MNTFSYRTSSVAASGENKNEKKLNLNSFTRTKLSIPQSLLQRCGKFVRNQDAFANLLQRHNGSAAVPIF